MRDCDGQEWVFARAACLLSTIALVLGGSPHARAAPAPESEPGHRRLVTEVQDARAAAYRRALRGYHREIHGAPRDVEIAVERCRFIGDLLGEDEDDGDLRHCLTYLEEAFPKHGEALLYRLDYVWGDELIELATASVEDPEFVFTPAQRARVHEKLALAYSYRDEHDAAERAARQAVELDPSVDVTLLLADAARRRGATDAAVELLVSKTAGSRDWALLGQKARVLLDLGAPARALTLLDAAAALEGSHVDPLLYARALEGVGRTAEARTKYSEQTGAHWNQKEVLLRLFRLDVERDDEGAAVASYRALRDLGWSADPMGRHRLRLLARFPAAPWSARELLGFLAFAGVLLLIVALPAVCVVPVHYIGLLRRARAHAPTATAGHDQGSLRDVWVYSAAVLLVDGVVAYLWVYEEFERWFSDRSVDRSTVSLADAAVYGIVSLGLAAVVALLFLRRPMYRALLRSDWSSGRTLWIAVACTFVMFVTWRVYVRVVIITDLWDPTAAGPMSSTVEWVLRGVGKTHGLAVLLALAAGVVPLHEEVLFRGIFVDGYARHVSVGWATVAQAMVFALMHDSLVFAPFFFLFGWVAGLLRQRSGGLLCGMMMHSFHNAIVCLLFAARGFG